MIRDLASLIAPLPADLFCDHFVRKTRFQVKATDPDRAAPLLPWSTINRMIESDGLPADSFKVVRAGNVVHPSLFRTRGDDSRLRTGTLQDLLRQGSSLVLNRIDEAAPSIGRLTAAIERELSCEVWCNAYLSFGAGSAFRAHYDLHDVVILQVHGRKHWQSFGVAVPHPIENPPGGVATGRDVVWEDTLEAGDVLYLPRGEVHMATLDGVDSVHLTIGLLPRRGLAFAQSMIKQAAEEVLFRQDIPVAAGEAALSQHEAALKRALHALIDRTTLSDYLDHDRRARPLRPFANLGIVGPWQADMLIVPAVRRRIPLDIDVDHEVAVLVGRERFRLSAPARRVLDFLLWHDECTYGAVVFALATPLSEPLVQSAVAELARQSLVGIRF